MTTTAQEILEKFTELPAAEKKKIVSIILRESLDTETPELSDDELVLNAEEIFFELDKNEEENGKS